MKLLLFVITVLWYLTLKSRASSVDVTQRDEYLNKIVEDVWNQLIEYDYSNLPVEDYDLAYNTTTWGHELVGIAYYEDGFLMDLESVEVNSRATSAVITLNEILLRTEMYLRNIDILFDVRAEFTVGNKVGTVVIRPETYVYSMTFTQDLATMNVVGAIVTESNSNDNFVWDFSPDDPLFKRLRKHYVTQARGVSIVRTAVSKWRPIFDEMVKNAVERADFPDLIL